MAEIAARLDDRFRLLTGGPRTALPRQQTLRATLDWSHYLLTESERVLLRRLAVFVGGWTLGAAEAVCAGNGVAADDVLDLLSGLVQKSLVTWAEDPMPWGGDSDARYRSLETIRQYALERLRASGEREVVRRRHALHYLALAERAEPELTGPVQGPWLARLEREHDNLRTALEWARANEEVESGLRLAGSLWRFWWACGHLAEGRGWLEQFLARQRAAGADVIPSVGRSNVGAVDPLIVMGPCPRAARAKALAGAGVLTYWQTDQHGATALLEESLRLSRERGDKQGMAIALNTLGAIAKDRGDYRRATALAEEGLTLRRGLGDRQGIVVSLSLLGLVAMLQGDDRGATVRCEESLSLARDVGYAWGMGVSLMVLGRVARERHDYQRVTTLFEECLSLARPLGQAPGVAVSLEGLAHLAWIQGQPERATLLYGAAAALRQAATTPLPPVERAFYDQTVTALRAALVDGGFEIAWSQGQALSLEDAVAMALSR